MRIAIVIIFNFLVLSSLITDTRDALAYGVSTHKILNEKATIQSNLDNFLKVSLGMSDGIETFFNGRKARVWMKEAGAFEDDDWRFLNHFHNPLQPWSQAGLNDTVLHFSARGQSSLLWGVRPDGVQGWSWHHARSYYSKALTAPTREEREDNFAKTFRAVGQVMHLVEDASVPAHVRNDAHPPILSGYHYETWAAANEDSLITRPRFPDLDLTASVNNMPPITHFIDTDFYQGTNPLVTNGNYIGLAEYTNAHFFSDDTIFAEDFGSKDPRYFLHPSKASVDLRPWTDETNNLQYLKEYGSKESGAIQHVVAVSWLYWYRQVYFPLIDEYLPVGLDEKVYEDQAARLVPRAVGYSAKLLDYFFRGRLDAESDGKDGIKITNASSEGMSGTFELYYDAIDPVTQEETRNLAGGPWTLTLASGAQSSTQTFEVPSDAKAPGEYWLVFIGKMGAESDAVAGSFIELKTIPFGFIIQDELIAPAPIMVSESGTDPLNPSIQFESRRTLWVAELLSDKERIPPQVTRGRFEFFQEPKSIILVSETNGRFYINDQFIPSGNWQSGDTPEVPKSWRYEEGGGYGCGAFCSRSAPIIWATFHGGESLQQALWFYKEVEKSTSVSNYHARFGQSSGDGDLYFISSTREAGMYVSLMTFIGIPLSYYAGGNGILPNFSTREQFEAVQLAGVPLGTDRCFRPDNCTKDFEFSFGFPEPYPLFLGYRRSKRDSYTAAAPAPVQPLFDLNVTGEVRRVYSTSEIAFLKRLGVTPIDYTITFR